MKTKPLFFCASLAFSCNHGAQIPQRTRFGDCILDRQRNEIVHTDLSHFFRHPIPPNVDLRFPIRCNFRSAFFISSDGFLNGIHTTLNPNSPFDLFTTQSDLRRFFSNLSDYTLLQNGLIILHFADGSTRRLSLVLD